MSNRVPDRNSKTSGVRNMHIKSTVTFVLWMISAILWADPVIVTPKLPAEISFPPGETVCYAAKFLQMHIRAATGKNLAIIPESEAEKYAERIWIGNTRFSAQNLGEIRFQPEELLIQSVDSDLILCGEITPKGIDRGTLFAVYEYLERALGIRWFFADISALYPDGLGTVIPVGMELKLSGWNIRTYPRCRQREGGVSYYYEPVEIQKKWHPVLRFGSSLPYRNANHTQINWYHLYHETHPEYFAKDRTGRVSFNHRLPHRNYICPNASGLLEQMLENIAAADAGCPPENAWGPCPPEKNYVYFAFNDGMTLQKTCHCSICERLLQPEAPEAGQASELVFDFVTRYARAVGTCRPERSLVTLAFHHYRKPPVQCDIPENLNVIYVTKLMHYANDPATWNAETAYIRDWAYLLKNNPDRLRIWLNIVHPMQYVSRVPCFYPNLFRKWLRANLQYSDAYFINGLNPYLKRLDESARRKTLATYPMVWLQSRLLWNPDTEVEALLADYTANLYGPAGKTMFRLFQLLTERWEKCPMPSDADEENFIHTVRFPQAAAAEVEALFEQAVREASEDDMARRRVEFCYSALWRPFAAESEAWHQKRKVE